MSGGSHIKAVGSGTEHEDEVLELSAHASIEAQDADWETAEEAWDAEDSPAIWARPGWILPAVAISAVVGWTAFFGWANSAEILAGGTAQQWSAGIVAWSAPVLLVVALWLLAMRHSTRETARFKDAAQALRLESNQLEERLSVVNRELSLAREFLAAQSRELESLGRVASERLSEHADNLQSLVQTNGAQVDAIASVSSTALENMSRLRDDLPVVANSARDVSNQIGNAGMTAHSQLEELVLGFERLNEFGQASERQVSALRAKVDEAIAGFEAQAAQMEQITGTRFAALKDKSEEFRAEIDGREVEALAAMRNRADKLREEVVSTQAAIDEQEGENLKSLQARVSAIRDGVAVIGRALAEGEKSATAAWQRQVDALKADLKESIAEIARVDEAAMNAARARLEALTEEAGKVDEKLATYDASFTERLSERQRELAELQETSASSLSQRLEELDAAIAERREDQIAQTRMLTEHGEAIAARIAELSGRMSEIAEQGSETEAALARSVQLLAGKLTESRAALDGTDSTIEALTEASVRLLELIQGAVRNSQTELPEAIGNAEDRLTEVVQRTDALKLMLGEAGAKGEELSTYVLKARSDSEESLSRIEALHAKFADANGEHAQRLEELRTSLATLREESRALSGEAQGELRDAIAALEEAAREAIGAIGEGSARKVDELAEKVGVGAAEAVDRALRMKTTESIAQLEQAAAHASGVSREAAKQLRDQLAMVNELTGNLESRVQRARERAEEQVDNDFSRRVALITEALNSNAIDISKALSSEVTDTAWTSYLRGDRGIFTRRAVRLLDNTEARDIAGIYDADPDFREHVSRYIHDFEAMLRVMLSTRDGNALGVTLLSSDMGKLYVALAQAIERLRD
jgi:chromosome segregation ATPase